MDDNITRKSHTGLFCYSGPYRTKLHGVNKTIYKFITVQTKTPLHLKLYFWQEGGQQ